MELVYSYGMENEKAMNKLLDEEFFKRLGPTVRECKAMGLEKDGFCMYIKARDDLVEEARKLLADSPAKPLAGEEGEKLLKAFRDEAEAAEAGMGALFG
ncbi:MAG TPA: hypothetical protein VLB04_00765 [Methanotrichaceae archaeon]|nr:hypothetical protein [Methanotrichaceae archaeon]